MTEFGVYSTKLGESFEEQLWEWYDIGLAPARIKLEDYYAGTEVRHNAYRKGDETTTAVRLKELGVTINWSVSKDG